MAKSYSVIEINGNRYDAVSGQLLGTVKKVSDQVKNAPTGVIDGFTRRAVKPSAATTTARLQAVPPKKSRIRKVNRNLKSPAQNVHKRTQKSITLMRGTVSKPSKKKYESGIRTNHVRTAAELKRASRAQQAVKHAKIKRFGGFAQAATAVVSSDRPAKPAIISPTPVRSDTAKAVQAVGRVSSPRPAPSAVGNISGQQLERLLDQALMGANSHKNPSKMNPRLGRAGKMPKWASIGASLLIVVVLGGFFAWQNMPNLSMQLAARRANIPASVPSYTPSGFSFEGPIGYSNGAVSIRFKANSDSFRTFTIRQEKSSWDSQSLAANVLSGGSQVQTSQVKGTTVYIYGPGNDAAWVDRGIKYTIQDQASLTSDQILKIAGSL